MASIDDQYESQADYLDALAAAIRRIEGRQDAQARAALEALLGEGTPARLGGAASLLGGQGLAQRIGTTAVGDTMGGGAFQYPVSAYNLVLDPTLEGQSETAINLTTSDQVIAYGAGVFGFGEANDLSEAWYAKSSVAGGQLGLRVRRGQRSNPFNSDTVGISPLAARTITLHTADLVQDSSAAAFPYLTAGIGLWRYDAFGASSAGSQTVVLEIYDVTAASVRASATFDVQAMAMNDVYRVTCSYQVPTSERQHTWQLRVSYTVGGSITGFLVFQIGEPTLMWSFTADTPPFAPVLGRWQPHVVERIGSYFNNWIAAGRMFGESSNRFELTVAGWLEWFSGAGGEAQARLRRTGAKELTWDDGDWLGAGAGTYTDDAGPVRTKHLGPHFVQGPNAMDLAVTYASPGKPSGVTRADEGVGVSSTVINYAGALVSSVVTTRFGKTLTVTPTYTGADITSVHRAVT